MFAPDGAGPPHIASRRIGKIRRIYMENYIYRASGYSAEVSQDFITVRQNGRKLCSLMPMTAVAAVLEKDGEFTEKRDANERITAFEALSDGVFRWQSESDLWKKEYLLECDGEGFTYSVKLSGEGALGKTDYFGGMTGEEDTDGSRYHFCEYFFPCPGCSPKKFTRLPAALPYRSFFELLIPPSYVYSFRTEDMEDRFGLGLIAKEGEYNFIHFDYETASDSSGRHTFFLSTDFEGHTRVNGSFELPKIRSFFGGDDIAVVKKYADYHFDSGLCRKNNFENVPRWWHGPIVCGWNEQGAQVDIIGDGRGQQGMAAQDVYMKIAGMIEEHNIRPTILIIDDKWQHTYGDCYPDPERWPDMRAFTDEMHRRGIHTLLWFRLWGGEGLPEDEVMPGGGIPYNSITLNYAPYADPTNEKYRARLKKLLHLLLSDEEGCMNCDGFKLDYSLVMPYGKTAKSSGGQYGAEMTKRLYKLIYETAKEIKPDALINASPCHPYFAEVCDMARLHDYAWDCRNETEQMRLRAKLFDAALPGVLIDTDSVNFTDEEDAMRFYRAMPEVGIPDIYQFSNTKSFELTEENWAEIEKMFNDYSDEADRLYGKG